MSIPEVLVPLTFATPCLVLALTAAPSLGADIPVDTLLDGADDCSLEDAIAAANTDKAVDRCPAGVGADRILLGEGLHVVVDTLTIASEVVVEGVSVEATAVTDADDFRVFVVQSGATATLRDLRVQDAADGALVASGSAWLDRVHVSRADNDGIELGPGGFVQLRDSTIEGSRGNGVGMVLGGSLEVVNSTLSGNSAWGLLVGLNGTVVVRHGTVVRNGTGIGLYNGATATIASSIVGDNRNADLDVNDSTLVSEGGNVLGDASGGGFTLPSDQLDVDPRLGGLVVASFDERPPVYALLSDSPALGAGRCLDLDGSPLALDARGAPRARCDAGAYERVGIVVEDVPAGPDCAAGGTRITIWDIAPPEERLVCDSDVLVESERDALAADCPAGGVVVRWGADDNGDGVLQADEVDESDVVCDDEPQPEAPQDANSGGCTSSGAAPSSLVGLVGLLVAARRRLRSATPR